MCAADRSGMHSNAWYRPMHGHAVKSSGRGNEQAAEYCRRGGPRIRTVYSSANPRRRPALQQGIQAQPLGNVFESVDVLVSDRLRRTRAPNMTSLSARAPHVRVVAGGMQRDRARGVLSILTPPVVIEHAWTGHGHDMLRKGLLLGRVMTRCNQAWLHPVCLFDFVL